MLLSGELRARARRAASNPRLFLEFQGDIQQGIIPPLLFAGGLFRFGITIPSTGRPIIQLSLGVVASIGGDLIKGLLEVEVTVHYGYTLIPETLQPGVLLGLDARAKLLGGLVGFSFGVEAMARLKRVDDDGVRIWAHIRVAATVQIAWSASKRTSISKPSSNRRSRCRWSRWCSGANPILAGVVAAVE